VSGRAGLSGTPMRHLFWRLGPREVLLLPSLVVRSPGLAVLVLRAGPLQPLLPRHRPARRTVDVAPVTGATDPHRHPAPRARKPRASAAATPLASRGLYTARDSRDPRSGSPWVAPPLRWPGGPGCHPGLHPLRTPLRLPQLLRVTSVGHFW